MSKINAYTCGSGHTMIIRDTPDRQTTPMFNICPECGEQSASAGYQVPQDLEPEYEWFKAANVDEVEKNIPPAYKEIFTADMMAVLVGSLMYRPI